MKSSTLILILSGLVLVPAYAYSAEMAPTSSPEATFITSDINRSGSIDLDEFSNYIEQAEGKTSGEASTDFSQMDINRDRKLTLEELKTGEQDKPVYPSR